MRVISRNIVYGNRYTYAGASNKVKRLANGDVVVVFRESVWRGEFYGHEDPTTRATLVRSTDDGETWHTVITADAVGATGVTINQMSDGRLVVVSTHSRWVPIDQKQELMGYPRVWEFPTFNLAVVPDSVYISRSTSDGYNWDSPRPVAAPGSVSSMSHGPVIELEDGSWLIPQEGFGLGRQEPKAWVSRSTDGGETWKLHGTVADSKDELGFWELRLLQLPSGRILATMRTQEANFYQAHSDDGGKTWSPYRDTGIWCHGSSPLDMLLLEDGRVLCTYGQRREPYGIYACLLTDEGENWHFDERVTLRAGAPDRDFGYPNSELMDDGSILTVYYWHEEGQTRHIASIRWALD